MPAWIANLFPMDLPRLAPVVPDLFLKSLVILLLAGAASLCWRRGSAALRHFVWFLALTGCLCLPALSPLVPAWDRPIWTVGSVPGRVNELALTFAAAPVLGRPGVEPEVGEVGRVPSPVGGQVRQASSPNTAQGFKIGWAAAWLTVWGVGTVLAMAWLGLGWLRLRSIRAAAVSPADPLWSLLLRQLRAEIGLRREVTLLQARNDTMPVTWGSLRPVVLLPASADNWSAARRRAVLLHELAHVRRWDCLTQNFARLACAVYWFNPMAWVAARRMCVEREQACDNLVLNRGLKASEYAAHLVEIARTFQPLRQVAAIGMARSSQLGTRVAAIVDASRVRRAPGFGLLAACALGVVGMVVTVAAQKQQAVAAPAEHHWFDDRLRAFFRAKEAQARRFAAKETEPVPSWVWTYFAAGAKGDWQTATNLWVAKEPQREGVRTKMWSPILETYLAWEQCSHWNEKHFLAFGKDIIKSIPPGSVYLGGTDCGRGVITIMCNSQIEAKPFYTLTQNALADGTYMDYLRTMYGASLAVPTVDDSQHAFETYMADAQRRLAEGKLKPGEDVKLVDGKVQVSGQVAVMAINANLARMVFDSNSTREFYVEESFPLDWMYPYLEPHGLIMRINREPLDHLSADTLKQDHQYWANYVRPWMGESVREDGSAAEVAAFAEKVFVKHNLAGFTGEKAFLEDVTARQAFAKLRNAIGGIYAWRLQPGCPAEFRPKDAAQSAALQREADFAFRQAFALCPASPEAVFRYVQFLLQFNRVDDAILVTKVCLGVAPDNATVRGLLENLERIKGEQHPATGDLERLEEEARTNPSDVQALLRLASAYAQNQDFGKIQSTLERVVKIAPTNPEAWYDLAAIRANLAKPAEALSALKQALDLSRERLKRESKARNLLQDVRDDARFKSLRESPEFKQLVPAKDDSASSSRSFEVPVTGEVRVPGATTVPADEVFTVSKAILRAGGFTEFAKKNAVKVERKRGSGTPQVETVDLSLILLKGKSELDLKLKPGDSVVVPRKDDGKASNTGEAKGGAEGIEWQPWSLAAIGEARTNGRPVLVDFTADWCLAAQINKRNALEVNPVRAKIKATKTLALIADCTRQPAAMKEELERYHRAGVPMVLVYPKDPSQTAMVLPIELTPEAVLAALEKAAQ